MSVKNLAQKRHRLRKLRGETAYIDTRPAVLHIATLQGAGWSLRSIGGAAKVSPTTVSKISRGQQATAAPATLARILAVRPDQIPTAPSPQTTEPFVPRIGTVRRLQALMFMGWRHADLKAHGVDSINLLHQKGRWVTLTRHQQVEKVFNELWSTPGPSEATRRRARRLGYVGPLDWDDIDHDPEPIRHEPERQRQIGGWHEDYDWLTLNGVSHREALDRLGVSQSAWEKTIERRGGAA